MCTPAQVATYMLADLFHREDEGSQVFALMNRGSLEAIVSCGLDESPDSLLRKYCEAFGGDIKERRCVSLPRPRDIKHVPDGIQTALR